MSLNSAISRMGLLNLDKQVVKVKNLPTLDSKEKFNGFAYVENNKLMNGDQNPDAVKIYPISPGGEKLAVLVTKPLIMVGYFEELTISTVLTEELQWLQQSIKYHKLALPSVYMVKESQEKIIDGWQKTVDVVYTDVNIDIWKYKVVDLPIAELKIERGLGDKFNAIATFGCELGKNEAYDITDYSLFNNVIETQLAGHTFPH